MGCVIRWKYGATKGPAILFVSGNCGSPASQSNTLSYSVGSPTGLVSHLPKLGRLVWI